MTNDVYFVDANGNLHVTDTKGGVRTMHEVQLGMPPKRTTPTCNCSLQRSDMCTSFHSTSCPCHPRHNTPSTLKRERQETLDALGAYGHGFTFLGTDPNGNKYWQSQKSGVYRLTPNEECLCGCRGQRKHDTVAFLGTSANGDLHFRSSIGTYYFFDRRSYHIHTEHHIAIARCPDKRYEYVWNKSHTTILTGQGYVEPLVIPKEFSSYIKEVMTNTGGSIFKLRSGPELSHGPTHFTLPKISERQRRAQEEYLKASDKCVPERKPLMKTIVTIALFLFISILFIPLIAVGMTMTINHMVLMEFGEPIDFYKTMKATGAATTGAVFAMWSMFFIFEGDLTIRDKE